VEGGLGRKSQRIGTHIRLLHPGQVKKVISYWRERDGNIFSGPRKIASSTSKVYIFSRKIETIF
jgi:hypothetical protein